jgi:hypothetical protein
MRNFSNHSQVTHDTTPHHTTPHHTLNRVIKEQHDEIHQGRSCGLPREGIETAQLKVSSVVDTAHTFFDFCFDFLRDHFIHAKETANEKSPISEGAGP